MISKVDLSFSTPSWWIPDACLKALAPTIALLGCTGNPVMSLTMRLVR